MSEENNAEETNKSPISGTSANKSGEDYEEYNELDGKDILKITDEVDEKVSEKLDLEKEWGFYDKYFQQEYGIESEGEALEALLKIPTPPAVDEIPIDYKSDELVEEEEGVDWDKISISEKDSFERLDASSLLKGVSQQRIGRESIYFDIPAKEKEKELEEGEQPLPKTEKKREDSALLLLDKKPEEVDFEAKILDEIAAVVSEEEEEEGAMEFIEAEEEAVIEEYEETEVPLDRDALIEEYKQLVSERYICRRRNFLFKRRLAEHFKRRHMEHAYKEYMVPPDLEDRYERKLIAFRELDQETNETKLMISEEVEKLRLQKITAKEETNAKFEELLARELEVGLSLVTQGTISQETVCTLVNNKRLKAWQLSKIRLLSIKLREKIKEAENRRLALESIGPRLRLMDYEEMQIEFNNFMDKIDERIEQMVRLREKVRSDVQIMAHMRERYFAQIDDIKDLQIAVDDADQEISSIRTKITKLVRIREDHRYQTLALKDESGLLTYTNLLHDFQNTLNEIDLLSMQLKVIQDSYNEKKPLLLAVREAMELLKFGKRETQFFGEAEIEEEELDEELIKDDSLVKIISNYSTLIPSYEDIKDDSSSKNHQKNRFGT